MEKSTKSWVIWIGITLQGTITYPPKNSQHFGFFEDDFYLFPPLGYVDPSLEGRVECFFFSLAVFSVRFGNACLLLRMILALGTHTHSMHTHNTVDGRNPAPPGMYKNLYINYQPQLVSSLAGFLPSGVLQRFSHFHASTCDCHMT